MIGSKWVKALAGIVVLIVMGMLWVGYQRESVRLRRENEALARQIKQLEQRENENNSLSNQIAQAESADANQQLLELVRLRNEVGMFRRQTNEWHRLQEQLEQLNAGGAAASQSTNATAEPLAVYPKDKWAFVGYDTPENAFQSLNWAALNGDMTMLKSNLTLDAQREFARAFEQNSEAETREQLMRTFNEKNEVRILTKDVISDNFVVLAVSDGKHGDNVDKLIFRRIDGQWKFVGDH